MFFVFFAGSAMEEVVVTGMGCVSPLGNDPEVLWKNLLAGKSGVSNIERFNTDEYPVHFAGEVKVFDPTPYFTEKELKRYPRNVLYAMHSAMTALEQSGLDLKTVNHSRAGVILASGMGGVDVYYNGSLTLANKGPKYLSPYFMPSVISNLASNFISIRLGWMGPSFATLSACASSNYSLISAVDQIRLGRADIMIAGGSEESVGPLALSGFSAMNALSRRNDSPETASRPFDKNRNGFVLGEGAGVLILESRTHAENRGAKILASVPGVSLTADAYHISAPREDGKSVTNAIRYALKEAKIKPQQLRYINTHGTSSLRGDIAESIAIYNAYDGKIEGLKINSTKSLIGHLLGAASAVESIVTILSLRDQKIHISKNIEEKDPDIIVDVVDKESIDYEFEYAICNSLGFGGHNSVVIFGKES